MRGEPVAAATRVLEWQARSFDVLGATISRAIHRCNAVLRDGVSPVLSGARRRLVKTVVGLATAESPAAGLGDERKGRDCNVDQAASQACQETGASQRSGRLASRQRLGIEGGGGLKRGT